MTSLLLILLLVVWSMGGAMFVVMVSMINGGSLSLLEKAGAILGWPFLLLLILLSFSA